MQLNALLVVICCAALFLDAEVCLAESPEVAVKIAVRQQKRGNTDIDGDGLAVMPVTIKKDGTSLAVSGVILHTWKGKEATPISYDVTINKSDIISGSIEVKRVNNPDGKVIKSDKKGHLSGKVGEIKCDILMEHRSMRGAVRLIGMVLTEVKK